MYIVDDIWALLITLKSKSYNFYINYGVDMSVTRMKQDNGITNKLMSFFSKPNKIIEKNNINLYLGSAYNSANYDTLKSLKINKIINVTEEIPNHFEDEIEYLKIPILDNSSSHLSEEILHSVNDFVNENDNVYVHCYQGASRSAAIILHLLISKFQYDVDTGMDYLCDKHPITNINLVFINDLKDFHKKIEIEPL